MGAVCDGCTNSNTSRILAQEVETENEIVLFSYSSKPDGEFKKLETKYNLLGDISFQDYMYSLVRFDLSNATLQDDYKLKPGAYTFKDSFFRQPFEVEYFQSFIENKILKHENLYVKAGNDEFLRDKFREMLLCVYKSLQSKLLQNDKITGITDNTDNRIKKGHCMIFGLLFAVGTNIAKIRFIFNLFQENGKIKPSDELKEFLLAMFLTSSYCILYARNKLGVNNPDVPALDKSVMKKILDTCELKDSMNLSELTMKEIFNGQSELSYEAFKSLFNQNKESLGWLISVKGIRHALEEHNV